jgi:hypothetical protein
VNRRTAIIILACVVLVAGAILTYRLWPKQYRLSEQLAQTTVFWNDHEAFFFLATNTSGRASNVLQQKVQRNKFGLFLVIADPPGFFVKQDMTAYHLLASGKLDSFKLPEQTGFSGSWSLQEGRLQFTPYYFRSRPRAGFRWDGRGFTSVEPPKPQPTTASTTLSADDLAEEDEDDGFLGKDQREKFKEAGWHYKVLPGYYSDTSEATLPVELGDAVFKLTARNSQPPKPGETQPDSSFFGIHDLELSGTQLGEKSQVLWSQKGWKEISKSEYQFLSQKYGGHQASSTRLLVSLTVVLVLVVMKFVSWGQLLFAFGTMKKKILNNMATAYSFPPVTPAQFPQLDLPELDRYTRQFESMGFVRLLDFSLTADKGVHPPSFCRLLVNTRYHCFAEISQLFPRGKNPMPLKGSILSRLQDGWTIGFSDRKPLAASSLFRRKRAIGILMPDASVPELFQSLLKMRDQVCMDLGISPLTDDTLEAYVQQAQRSLAEMREAIQQKRFAFGLPQVYWRKLSALKTKPEYTWLGDYPREAERRKQAYGVPVAAR